MATFPLVRLRARSAPRSPGGSLRCSLAVAGRREEDEFKRIRVTAEIEKDRDIVARNDVHQAFFRNRIEDKIHELGRLNERLGDPL
jgi:hypothetical protein